MRNLTGCGGFLSTSVLSKGSVTACSFFHYPQSWKSWFQNKYINKSLFEFIGIIQKRKVLLSDLLTFIRGFSTFKSTNICIRNSIAGTDHFFSTSTAQLTSGSLIGFGSGRGYSGQTKNLKPKYLNSFSTN